MGSAWTTEEWPLDAGTGTPVVEGTMALRCALGPVEDQVEVKDLVLFPFTFLRDRNRLVLSHGPGMSRDRLLCTEEESLGVGGLA